jgi:hypothetical protein
LLNDGREVYEGGSMLQDPRWAPDGSEIVFRWLRGIGPDGCPDNSSRIAYTKVAPNGTGALWVMNRDGSGQHEVMAGTGTGAAWAPDGRSIAVSTSDPDDLDRQIIAVVTGHGTFLAGRFPEPHELGDIGPLSRQSCSHDCDPPRLGEKIDTTSIDGGSDDGGGSEGTGGVGTGPASGFIGVKLWGKRFTVRRRAIRVKVSSRSVAR